MDSATGSVSDWTATNVTGSSTGVSSTTVISLVPPEVSAGASTVALVPVVKPDGTDSETKVSSESDSVVSAAATTGADKSCGVLTAVSLEPQANRTAETIAMIAKAVDV